MVTGIIGRKVGMTQLFGEDGSVLPATVIKAGPCVVVQRKTATTDGYESVQLGLVDMLSIFVHHSQRVSLHVQSLSGPSHFPIHLG